MNSLPNQQQQEPVLQQWSGGVMFVAATEQFAVMDDRETSGKDRRFELQDDDDDDIDTDEIGSEETEDRHQLQRRGEMETGAGDEVVGGWRRVSYWCLPEWLRDNELIETGHRPPLDNFHACLQSVLSVHSETGNIWTHLIGMLIVGVLALEHLSRPHTEAAWQEKASFSVFYTSQLSCFAYSFVCHTFSCHSPRVFRCVCMFDYVGIVMAITCSLMPWLYYGYHCRLQNQLAHVALSISLCVVCLVYIALMFDDFIRRRRVKAGVFLALGLSCLVPATHLAVLIGNHESFVYLSLMGASYVLGAVIYATRMPERIWPGSFDTWLSSHQWFHILCVVAMLSEYHALSLVAQDRLRFGGCLPPPT